MKVNSPRNQRGFSIVELLIVLVILGILTTLAIIQFRGASTDFERQRIVQEFKVYLERARFDSVKRRASVPSTMAQITLNGSSSFTAMLDFDGDGVMRANETRVVDFSTRSSTQIIVTDTLNYPITMRFDQRGHILARDSSGNDVEPLFTICSNCSSASPDRTSLAVSTTGTVAILRNGQSPGSLPAPNISNTTPSLNCYVLVGNTSGCALN